MLSCHNTTPVDDEVVSEITAFWLGPSLQSPESASNRRDWWYRGGTAVDEEIGARFGGSVVEACNGNLSDWLETPNGALALILLLDQFTRNLYRNTPEAYRGDSLAMVSVNHAIECAVDRKLHPVARIWLYHPFHHSELVAEQDRGIEILTDLKQHSPPDWQPYVQRSIEGWSRHRDIVARFGRFPHRNQVLGRVSTDEEQAYLKSHGQSFGQGPRLKMDP